MSTSRVMDLMRCGYKEGVQDHGKARVLIKETQASVMGDQKPSNKGGAALRERDQSRYFWLGARKAWSKKE